MYEAERLETRVERGDFGPVFKRGGSDEIPFEPELLEIVPGKMYKVHVGFGTAWFDVIDTDNDRMDAEFAIRKSVN